MKMDMRAEYSSEDKLMREIHEGRRLGKGDCKYMEEKVY
jgi:hypothetical protein